MNYTTLITNYVTIKLLNKRTFRDEKYFSHITFYIMFNKLLFSLLTFYLFSLPYQIIGQTGYVLFTASGAINNTGATVVTGDIGTYVGAFNGFPPGFIVGKSHVADPSSTQAAADVAIAYGNLSAQTCNSTLLVTLGNGQIITPGVYCTTAASTINGDLIFDAKGDPNAMFIVKIDGTLSTSAGSRIVLLNGAGCTNVIFQVNGAVTLGAGSSFKGSIIASGALNFLAGASLGGKAFTTAGAINLNTNNVTIAVQPIVSLTVTPTSCGKSNGSILVTTNASSPTYVWSVAGVTGNNPMNLASGNYTVTVTDGLTGCSAIASTIVGTSNNITATILAKPTTCGINNGSILVTTNASLPIFTWSVVGVTGNNPMNLASGNYTVTVTDASTSCSVTAGVTVGASNGITANAVAMPTTCGKNNGSISVTTSATNPTFAWSVPGVTGNNPMNLASGNYTVTVTDGTTGCFVTASATVGASNGIIASAVAMPTSCRSNSGSILVTTNATNPMFTWNVAGVTGNNPMNLPAGNYIVTVTDVTTGCFVIASATVGNSGNITASAVATPTTCGNNNGSISVTTNATNPMFAWSVANVTGSNPQNLPAGNYTVTVTDGTSSCTFITSATVGASNGITASAVAMPTTCGINNGSILVTTNASSPTFTWSVAGVVGNNPMNLASGNYTVTVTDSKTSCFVTASATVGASNGITASAAAMPTACGKNSGSILVTTNATNPMFTWSVAGVTGYNPMNLAAGNYTVTVTDGTTGCTFIASATIGNSNGITASAVATPTTCGKNNGSISVTTNATNPRFTWNVAGVTGSNPMNLASGNYTVTVTDGTTGCNFIVSATVQSNQTVNCNITSTNANPNCNNPTTQLCVQTGYTSYSWSTGANTACITVNTSGNYSVTVTDANGCSSNCNITINVAASVTPVIVATGATTFCNGDSVILSGNNNGGTWSNGAKTPTITVTTPGDYFFTLTNNCGTFTSNHIVVKVDFPAVPSVITTDNSTSFCEGGQVTLTAYSADPWNTATWNTGATTPVITVTTNGDYYIINTNKCGSATSNHITTKVFALPNAIAGKDTTICGGDSVQLGAKAIAGRKYKWTPALGLSSDTVSNPVAKPIITTIYILTESTDSISSTNIGCQKSNSVTITVTNPLCNITVTGTLCQGRAKQLCVPKDALQYAWSTGENTNCISVTDLGTYSVSITNAKGCKSICSQQITADTFSNCTFGATVSLVTDINCQGSASGVVMANAVGGVAPYTYLWSNNYHEKVIQNLVAGTYFVTITDKNCCTAVAQITIVDAVCVNIINAGTISGDQSFCKQSDLQPITELTPASGGSGDIVYMWMYSTVEGDFGQSHYQLVPGSGNTKNLTVFPNVSVKTYFVRCVSRKGCCNFFESNIITKFPTVNTLITGATTFCVNTVVNFSTPTNSYNTTYFWTATNATNTSSTSNTFSTKFINAGLQTVHVTVSKDGCVGEFTKYINAVNCQSASGSFFNFTVESKNSKNVNLNWKTINEIVASNYEVEHSDDGTNFYMMAKVASLNGKTNNYDFVYDDPKMGSNFFRIKHNEDNGDVTYSEIRQSVIGSQELIAYPNPTSNKLYIEMLSMNSSDGTFQIFNTLGKLMINQKYEKDQNRYEVDMNYLPTGTFILRVLNDEGVSRTVKINKE